MVVPVTEQESPQKLEAILKDEPSEEVEDVSEEAPIEEEVEEAPEEEKEEDPLSPENFESKVQAEADKRVNPYRIKREADTALIRRQASEIAELRKETQVKGTDKLIAGILSGDEDAGFTEEETKSREAALKEFAKRHTEYTEKSLEIEETAQYISDVTEKLPSKVVKGFGLDDPNPNVRAKNGVDFFSGTAAIHLHNQDFLMAVEEFLPKGDELRTKIEALVDGMAEFESDKSKKLFLEKEIKGLKVTPRKAPKASSDGSGGTQILKGPTATNKNLAEGLAEERKKLKL